jgi:hypothetical protein
MFKGAELMFNACELVFKPLELMFSALEHKILTVETKSSPAAFVMQQGLIGGFLGQAKRPLDLWSLARQESRAPLLGTV